MQRLILDIQDRLRSSVPELQTIDEDYGQLQMMFQESDDSDVYPVVSPAVTINVPDVSWQSLAGRVQHGAATVVVTLAIDCYDDTHLLGSPDHAQRALISDRINLMKKIHAALHGWKPSTATRLVRTATRLYHLPHLWKAYENTYSCLVDDSAAEPSPSSALLNPSVHGTYRPLSIYD